MAIPRAIQMNPDLREFLHCSVSGPSTPATSTGVPDGSLVPSFVRDHRVRYVFKPKSGQIQFALLPGPYGAVCLGAGELASITIPKYAATSGYDVNPIAISAYDPSSMVVGGWGQLPYPVLPNRLGTKPFSTAGVTGFRLISCVADARFTGSDMYNNGSWMATPMSLIPQNAGKGVNISARDGTIWYVTEPQPDLVRPDSLLGTMRDTVRLRALPNSYEYQSIISEGYYLSPVAARFNPVTQLFSTTQLTSGWTPGIYNYSNGVIYSASGLDASASITVDVKVCIEYMVDMQSSPFQDLLKPSPPETPGFLDHVKNVLRTVPVAKIVTAATGSSLAGSLAGLAAGH